MDQNFNKGLHANMEYNNNVKSNTEFLNNLKSKLPEFFTNSGSFDLEKFKENLRKNNINELTNGYRLDFIGKNYAKKQTGERPTTIIVPDKDHNNKKENKESKNLFFSGDNLEVLRHLRQNYTNSIDCIYIDPPYNTGSDGFVYPDKFEYSDEQLTNIFGLSEEELIRLKSIQGKSTHSAWLAFMYPRLYLAKKLLKDTGMIFVSIDDNEQANLKLLMDEVFGELSFVADAIVKRKNSPNNMGNIPSVHDYLLIYAKNQVLIEDTIGMPLSTQGYKNDDNDSRGPWKTMPLSANHEGPYFEITNPKTGQVFFPPRGRYWVFNKEEIQQRIKDGRIIFGKSGNTSPVQKVFLNDRLKAGKLQKIGSLIESQGINNSAATELVNLLDNKVFENPKPTSLIKFILQIINNKKALVLDFFAGSATSADAVMQLNAEDGGDRQYIMVQLDEKTEPNSTAYKSGYTSIDQISRARIEKAADKIKNENPKLAEEQDLGFKHYRVLQPKQEALDTIEFNSDMQLDMFDDMINVFSSESLDVPGHASGFDTILQTYMVSDNYKFDVPIKFVDFAGIELPYVNESRIYLISNDWTSRNTKALVNAIGKNELTVQTIVVYGYTIEMESIRELEIALNQLENKVNLQVRY